MGEQPQNPTLLIGIGDFGRAVVELTSASPKPDPPDRFADLLDDDDDPSPIRPLETISVEIEPGREPRDDGSASEPRDDGADRDDRARVGTGFEAPAVLVVSAKAAVAAVAIVDEARGRARRLLDLGYFVDHTDATDSRGPRLDVFLVADLSDAGVADLVPLVVEQLGSRLRAEFRPILRAGEGALAVCPLLAAPREADRDRVAATLRALDELSHHADLDRRPQAKLYVVEDQSGKYVLSQTELERSFAAFLHLILFSRLRDDQGIRELVERSVESRVGPFATFACATLEVDVDALHKVCSLQLARETLRQVAPGVLPLSEIAAEAHPLVPERGAMESVLWREGVDGSLEEYLTPPRIHVAEVRWTDSPEEIVDHKFGPMWKMQTAKDIDVFRDEVERFKMDRLARQIERNGTSLVDEAEHAVLERVRAEMSESPRGPLRALEFAAYAHTKAKGLEAEAQDTIASPNLRRFPPSPLDGGIAAIAEATEARPRHSPFRMQLFGWLSIFLGTFMIGALVHAADSGLPWWGSALVGLAFALSTWGYLLWRHIKRHHNWVCQARDDLDQALQRYLYKDVVDYFRRRLNYTRMLWVYRIYGRLTQRLGDLVVQLEGGRAAINEAERRLSAQHHDLLERRGFVDTKSGILYRSVLRADTLDAFYRVVKPPDVSTVAERYLAHVVRDVDPLEAPFADPVSLLAFCEKELEHILEMSPYEDESNPLFAAVADSVRAYLRQLALKLSPPLEVIGVATGDAPTATRILVIPPDAVAMVEHIIKSDNLDRGWHVRPMSEDGSRIHLLIERGELVVDAVAAARPGGKR